MIAFLLFLLIELSQKRDKSEETTGKDCSQVSPGGEEKTRDIIQTVAPSRAA